VTVSSKPQHIDCEQRPNLARLIETIGDDGFGEELRCYVSGLFGAEHCTVLLFAPDKAVDIVTGSLADADRNRRNIDFYLADIWRLDPMIVQAQERIRRFPTSSATVHLPVSAVQREMKSAYMALGVRERIVIYGPTSVGDIAISMLRSETENNFPANKSIFMVESSQTLLAIAAKHSSLIRKGSYLKLLESLSGIETALGKARSGLSRREIQVCGRIIFGLSTLGISVDLGIGTATVVTHRRRAYHHLGIATRHELLRWYFRIA
jgi:DNA-binding CsgD family transcriptional regulator